MLDNLYLSWYYFVISTKNLFYYLPSLTLLVVWFSFNSSQHAWLCISYWVSLVYSLFLFLFLSDGGETLSWGIGGYGRLGHGHDSSILGFFKTNRLYSFFPLSFTIFSSINCYFFLLCLIYFPSDAMNDENQRIIEWVMTYLEGLP